MKTLFIVQLTGKILTEKLNINFRFKNNDEFIIEGKSYIVIDVRFVYYSAEAEMVMNVYLKLID